MFRDLEWFRRLDGFSIQRRVQEVVVFLSWARVELPLSDQDLFEYHAPRARRDGGHRVPCVLGDLYVRLAAIFDRKDDVLTNRAHGSDEQHADQGPNADNHGGQDDKAFHNRIHNTLLQVSRCGPSTRSPSYRCPHGHAEVGCPTPMLPLLLGVSCHPSRDRWLRGTRPHPRRAIYLCYAVPHITPMESSAVRHTTAGLGPALNETSVDTDETPFSPCVRRAVPFSIHSYLLPFCPGSLLLVHS